MFLKLNESVQQIYSPVEFSKLSVFYFIFSIIFYYIGFAPLHLHYIMLGFIRSTTSLLLSKYCKISHFQNYIFIINFYSIYHSKRGNLRQVVHFK